MRSKELRTVLNCKSPELNFLLKKNLIDQQLNLVHI